MLSSKLFKVNVQKRHSSKLFVQWNEVKLENSTFTPPASWERLQSKYSSHKGCQSKEHLSCHVTLTGKENWPTATRDGGSPSHRWPVPACYTGGSVSQKVEPQSKQYLRDIWYVTMCCECKVSHFTNTPMFRNDCWVILSTEQQFCLTDYWNRVLWTKHIIVNIVAPSNSTSTLSCPDLN